MLHSFQDLRRFTVAATDGDVGTVDDLLFDDRSSKVRFLVVDVGGFFNRKPVLIAPEQVARVETETRSVHVGTDRATLEASPPLDENPPVSRQTEHRVREYFGLAPVVATVPRHEMTFWGALPDAASDEKVQAEIAAREDERQEQDPYLRSAKEVIGYDVEGTDAHLGDVDDLLVDTVDDWHLSYLVVDTGRWLPGRRRLVGTDMLASVSYGAGKIQMNAARAQMADAPDFEEADGIDRSAESRLYRYWGFTPRW